MFSSIVETPLKEKLENIEDSGLASLGFLVKLMNQMIAQNPDDQEMDSDSGADAVRRSF